MNKMWNRRGAVAALTGLSIIVSAAGWPVRTATRTGVEPDLRQRMEAFIAAFDTLPAEDFAIFFPKHGNFKYRHTVHGDSGWVAEWIFPGSQARQALADESKPLWASFTVQWEGQPIGLFAHQVLERPGPWVRAYGTRYVPPGADPSSAIYVEWRREGDEWVISELGDELFSGGVPRPAWCCPSPG
jgi:hypothetical protein